MLLTVTRSIRRDEIPRMVRTALRLIGSPVSRITLLVWK